MDAALSDELVVAQGPFSRLSLFISLLAGNLVRRPVRTGLRRQAGSLVRTATFFHEQIETRPIGSRCSPQSNESERRRTSPNVAGKAELRSVLGIGSAFITARLQVAAAWQWPAREYTLRSIRSIRWLPPRANGDRGFNQRVSRLL
jgi:hypothetical protein